MAIIVSTSFKMSQFSFDKKTGLFCQEISTLAGPLRARRPVFSQIYDDACDEGLKMVSDKSGKEVVWYVVDVDTTGSGEDREIAGWRLLPTTESIRKVPECKDLKMLIIND